MLKGYGQVVKFFHFDNRTITDSTRPVPEMDSINQLDDPNILAFFETSVKEILDTDDGEIALLGRRVISDILLPQFPNIRQHPSEAYVKLQKMADLLKFVNLSIYPMQEIIALIKSSFLDVLKTKLPVIKKLQNVLDANNDIYLEGAVAEALANAVQACEQKVGDSLLLTVEAKEVIPALGNWLTDYIQFSLSHGERSTGSLARIEYLKINKNALKLREDEKNLLLRLFRIYDWLRYGGEADPEELFVKPEDYVADVPAVEYQMLRPLPLTPAPKNAPTLRPMEDVKEISNNKFQISNEGAKEKAASVEATDSKGEEIASSSRRDISGNGTPRNDNDLGPAGGSFTGKRPFPPAFQPGLKIGGYENNKPKSFTLPTESFLKSSPGQVSPLSNQSSKQAEIDRKLEELKKKTQNGIKN